MSLFPALTGVVSALPLANTTPTPATGEPVRAEDVQMAAQGLLNQDASLEAALNTEIANRAAADSAEAATRAANDTAEASARAAADSALNAIIPRTTHLGKVLTEYDGVTPFESVAGSGSSPGTWQKTTSVYVHGTGALNDTLECIAVFNARLSSSSNGRFKLVLTTDYGGSNVEIDVPGSVANQDSFGNNQRITLVGQTSIAIAGAYRVTLAVQTATSNTIDVLGDGFLRVRQDHAGP